VGKVSEWEEQMYPPIRIVRQSLRLGLVVLVVFALSACGGGAKNGAEKASKPELTTVAGDGGEQLGDGGPATEAGFCGTNDVALDASGNMYISDGGVYCSGPGGHTIRKVDPDGNITTVAGSGGSGFSGEGGHATKAQLNLPLAVTVDREGNLYIADAENHRIRKVDSEGIITTIAGTDETGFNREEGTATKVMLKQPIGLFVDDDAGVLYIGDTFNARVRAVYLEGS
jgi:trimeric autotransporter adhesin